MGDLFSFVSSKEVFLPPWGSDHGFLSSSWEKEHKQELAGEKSPQFKIRDKNQLPIWQRKQAGSTFPEILEKENGYFTDFNVGIKHLYCKD